MSQAGPLRGKRVVEIGTMLAAPFAAHILASYGAEVIKVEPPAGDPTRHLVRGGPGGTFLAYNYGKKSVGIDLSTPEGHAVFARLLTTADVIVHNLSPGSAARLRVTDEDCRQIRPDIIYCHIRGYGAGPLENALASNPVAEASTGVMDANRIEGRPSRLGPSYHDQFAGAYAVIGIMAALQSPATDKQARNIEIGLYETGLHVAARDLAGVQLKTQLLGRAEREPHGEFSMPGYGAYETADRKWIYLLMLSDGHWLKFCQALNLSEAKDDSLMKLRDRRKQRDRVEEIVRRAVSTHTFRDISDRLDTVGFGATEVLPLERVLDSPQARHAGKLKHIEFRGLEFDVPELPRSMGHLGPHVAGDAPPELGEHTLEVLRAVGVTASECERLLNCGAIAIATPEQFAWAPVRQARQ